MARGQSDLLAGMSGRLGNVIIYEMNGQTVIRARTPFQRGPGTAAQQRRRGAFGDVARMWRGLDAAQQAGWARLGARMPDWDGARGTLALSGYQCWLAVGTGRALLGLPPTPDAPDAPDPPPFLPAPSLSASVTGGVLSLTLSCGPLPFDAPVQILACRPTLPGDPTPRAPDFVQLALPSALPPGGVDIGPAYASKFGVPAPGLSITVRAVPLSPTGFRGQPLTAAGIVTP